MSRQSEVMDSQIDLKSMHYKFEFSKFPIYIPFN